MSLIQLGFRENPKEPLSPTSGGRAFPMARISSTRIAWAQKNHKVTIVFVPCNQGRRMF